ncbi:MAG TPA: PDZ domain-containing protein [Pyrinomonadaceae bacterium]|nr:PDZ domain-containing protein [Pyrinomonadaceae bacterium]
MSPETEPEIVNCGNCRTAMPRELRFCRSCGFRLGEGTSEYTETVRFPNASGGVAGGASASFNQYGGAGPMAPFASGQMKKRKKRMSGMTWMFLGLLIFFVVAAGLTAVVKQGRRLQGAAQTEVRAPRSFFGIENFDTAENNAGVTFDKVEPPGGPADLAGLVGGDIITSFDGRVLSDEDQMEELLESTPIGKTVEVVYIRDGEKKTTKLTTVNEEEFNRLIREFRRRPAGIGRFGYEEDDSKRVPVPGTNIFGVILNDVSSSMPADLAGIKEGDIVIEFDGVPIRTPEELHARVRRALPYSTVNIVLMRDGQKMEIPVKMGKL